MLELTPVSASTTISQYSGGSGSGSDIPGWPGGGAWNWPLPSCGTRTWRGWKDSAGGHTKGSGIKEQIAVESVRNREEDPG